MTIEKDFIQAIKENNLTTVKTLIQQGVDVNTLNGLALIYPVSHKNMEMIQLLVENKASNHLVLEIAAEMGYLEGVKYLLPHFESISNMQEVLNQAIKHSHLNIVEYLYQEKSVHPRTSTDFLITAVNNKDTNLAHFLIQHKANVKENETDLLKSASRNNDLPMVQLLVEHGARPSIAKQYGTPQIKQWATDYIANKPTKKNKP